MYREADIRGGAGALSKNVNVLKNLLTGLKING